MCHARANLFHENGWFLNEALRGDTWHVITLKNKSLLIWSGVAGLSFSSNVD